MFRQRTNLLRPIHLTLGLRDFLEDRYDLLEGRPLASVLVHADSNQPNQMNTDAVRNRESQVLESDLHTDLHRTELGERCLSGHDLPEQNRKRPHVAGLSVDLARLLLQRLRRHPGRMKQFVLVLERKLRVGHVDFGGQIIVNLKRIGFR